jgi:hypothetical protein
VTTLITRRAAVAAIARRLADRTAFVVFTPPAQLGETVARLRRLPGWTGYLDSGGEMVTEGDPLACAALGGLVQAVGARVAAVLIVPKTVPAAALGRALGQPIAADGSEDVIGVVDGQRVAWPLLLVDAIAEVDPVSAAQLHANSLVRSN